MLSRLNHNPCMEAWEDAFGAPFCLSHRADLSQRAFRGSVSADWAPRWPLEDLLSMRIPYSLLHGTHISSSQPKEREKKNEILSPAMAEKFVESESKTTATPTLPHYSLPTRGILSKLPPSWVPYGELMRIDKPTGIYLFYFPHLFGTLYGASLMRPKPSLFTLFAVNLYLFIGTVFMRGAACAWNDNMDREYDRKVYRCRLRPIARGAISPFQGHVFTGVLSAAAASFFVLLPLDCIDIAIPSVILLVLYPFAKRFTDYPQVVLGFQISIGITMGSAAIGMNPLALNSTAELRSPEKSRLLASVVALYASNIVWTIIYDTIYAHQDIKDDSKAGVKSMAVRFGDKTKILLSSLALIQVALLVEVGTVMQIGFFYFTITCGGALTTLEYMIWSVDLGKPEECWWWFNNGCWFTGGTIASGFMLEYLRAWPNTLNLPPRVIPFHLDEKQTCSYLSDSIESMKRISTFFDDHHHHYHYHSHSHL